MAERIIEDHPWASPKVRKKPGIGRRVDAAVRGAADMLSFGLADELQAGAEALPALKGGTTAYQDEYVRRWEGQQQRDATDRAETPVSRAVGQVGGLGAGIGLGAVANLGRLVPGAGMAGIKGVLRSLGLSTAAGAAGGAVQAYGSGSPGDRLEAVPKGAAIGAGLGAASVPVGAGLSAAGRAIGSIGRDSAGKAIRTLNGRAPQDAARLSARAAELRGLGIDPTLVDVLDDAGRGGVRAMASRMTPGRQVAQDFADTRALNLPSRMSRQARNIVSSDARTPVQITDELTRARDARAATAFGAVREAPVDPTDDLIQALRTPHARDAIAESVRRERDQVTRAGLNRLQNNAFDNPADLGLTVGMADRVSRVLGGRADAARQSGDIDLATTLGGLSRDIREPARVVTGYAQALDDYAERSRLIEAAEVGEDLLNRNTDEFVAALRGMTPEQRALARASGRRAIERRAGENIGSAPGIARQIANAPEQQARNAALLGADDATRLQDTFRAEAGLVEAGQQIAPRFGSQTQNKGQDAVTMGAGVISNMVRTARGDGVGVALDWLRSRGVPDARAEEIVRIATDPARTDEAMQIIGSMGGLEAGPLVSLVRASSVRPAAERQPAVTIESVDGVPYDEYVRRESLGVIAPR